MDSIFIHLPQRDSWIRLYLASFFVLVGLLRLSVQPVQAQTFPPNFAGVQLASGLDPVSMDIAPDGRIFLTEKNGKIRVVKGGSLLSTPFITLANVDNYNERGLLGIALDPNFSSNNYVYIYYTYKAPGGTVSNNRVSRLTASGDVAVEGSEMVLIDMPSLRESGIHNGGGLAFKDGKLMISVGDNTDTSTPQSLSSIKGKVLRINTDGSIPDDNPFYQTATGVNRAIWAIGFRNPFKVAVQPGTGRVFVGDVGKESYEEINEAQAGKNYGWPIVEGNLTYQTRPENYQDGFYTYSHQLGCAVTGGDFYNPSSNHFPAQYVGLYFFIDYCNGQIKTINLNTKAINTFATGINRAVHLKTGPDGSLYFIARGGVGGGSPADNTSSNSGILWKVTYLGSGRPVIGIQPASQTVNLDDAVTFSVSASGNPAPTYQWQRNGSNISGATSTSYTIPNASLNDSGSNYRVIISNEDGTVTSDTAKLTVLDNRRPIISITSPSAGKTYAAGDVINFAGTATDPEDGPLALNAYTWKIDFYHFDTPSQAHYHPVLEETSGMQSGSFMIPTIGETSPNVLYRIYLTAKDSKGTTTTSTVDVVPVKSVVTLTTLPAGLDLDLDGSAVTAPYTFTGVSGMQRVLEASPSQVQDGTTYVFGGWSNGQPASQALATPATNTTLTATYLRQAESVANLQSGLNYSYYQGTYTSLPNFSTSTPAKTGTVTNFVLTPRLRNDYFAFEYRGYIQVPADGRYVFYTSSDDGSRLWIGNKLVVDNDGAHAEQERSGVIYLQAGRHALRLGYFDKTSGEVLKVTWEGPGFSKVAIPSSALFRAVEVPNSAPVISEQPVSQSTIVGGSLSFSVTASGNPAPTYQWQRNGSNISGATGATYTRSDISMDEDGAKFRAVVTNSMGSVTSDEAIITVLANQPPVATITSPAGGKTYTAGEVISFSGTATDPEEGTLPASAYSWKVDFVVQDTPARFSPLVNEISGAPSGSFTIPTTGETSSNVLYRIYLTVKDSKGATTTSTVDVIPVKSVVTLTTLPAGLDLELDGNVVTTPYNFTGVSGVQRSLTASSPQMQDGTAYVFGSWSNGQPASQALATPATNTTLTATYLRQAESVANLQSGLNYSYYQGTYTSLPNFSTSTPAKTGTVTNFVLTPRLRNDYFAFEYSGYIQVPADGRYVFYTSSDDGSRLWIGNTLVVDNDGAHAEQERSGVIYLQAGRHALRVGYFEKASGEVLKVSWQGPDFSKVAIPNSALFRTTSSARLMADGAEEIQPMTLSNSPNPFASETSIRLSEPPGEDAVLEIYTIVGQLVKRIPLSADTQQVLFNGQQLSTGVYPYSLFINGQWKASSRLMLVR